MINILTQVQLAGGLYRKKELATENMKETWNQHIEKDKLLRVDPKYPIWYVIACPYSYGVMISYHTLFIFIHPFKHGIWTDITALTINAVTIW